jgi:hypothetical protein
MVVSVKRKKERNEALYWFGMSNLVLALLLIAISIVKPIELAGTNAWHKPVKFALSIGILSWTMGWYTGYLSPGRDIDLFNWTIVLTLAFEIVYIVFQAARGQASHFNVSTPVYSALYSMMALAASVATLAIAFIGYKFFVQSPQDLPEYFIWSIRLGIAIFVIFSFQGFAMGSRLSHTVGGPDGSRGLPFLNWSMSLGDLRVAHFIGMHALQILPLLAWYILKDIKLTFMMAFLYLALAIIVLVQALQAKPFVKI